MPIYAYRCDACGHRKDVLQKMSDPTLTVCPSCGAESFARQLSAPAFQLKGTGWYVTDFRDNGKKANGDAGKSAEAGEGGDGKAADGKAGEGKAAEQKPAVKSNGTGSESATPAAKPVSPVAKPDAAASTPAGGTSSAA